MGGLWGINLTPFSVNDALAQAIDHKFLYSGPY